MTYKIGTRVQVISGDHKNALGTIIMLGEGDSYGIRHDKAMGGHSMDGLCPRGYGWVYSAHRLTPCPLDDSRFNLS